MSIIDGLMAMEVIPWVCALCNKKYGWDAQAKEFLRERGFDVENPIAICGNLPMQAATNEFWSTRRAPCLVADNCSGLCTTHLEELIHEMDHGN